MTLNRDTLELIQETAVEANAISEYRIGHSKKLLIFRDGREMVVEKEPKEIRNNILTIKDAVRIFRECNSPTPATSEQPTIWVSSDGICVVHNNFERWGHSTVSVEMTRTAKLLLEADDKENWMKPEQFEKIALLRFGCDEKFIDRLRNLQWNVEQKESAQLSNVNKSMSASMLAKILDKHGQEFKDVFIVVRAPIFEVPCKTKEIEIEVQILANAEAKGICFAPKPGVMQENIREATRELYEMVCEKLDPSERDRVFMGSPLVS